jgi:hypothetical protein
MHCIPACLKVSVAACCAIGGEYMLRQAKCLCSAHVLQSTSFNFELNFESIGLLQAPCRSKVANGWVQGLLCMLLSSLASLLQPSSTRHKAFRATMTYDMWHAMQLLHCQPGWFGPQMSHSQANQSG